MFTSRLKDEIPAALELLFGAVQASGAQIETLNLNDNAIGPVTMPVLTPFLSSTACTASLKVLRLNNCGLGIKGGQMLSTVLPQLEHLTELIIGRNRLEVDGVRDIAAALEQLRRLEVLELPQNGTKAAGIEALMRAVTANAANLRVLNLNDNVLRKRGPLVAEAIRGLRRLQVLNLGDCLLGTDGALAVLAALQTLAATAGVHYLRELVLSGNGISVRKAQGQDLGETIIATVEQLLAGRASPSTVLRLDLGVNNLGEELVGRLQAHFSEPEVVELLIAEDEGSDDEEEEEEEEEEGEEASEDEEGGEKVNGEAGGDDGDVQEASPLKNGKGSRKSTGPPPTLESLVAKHEAAFTTTEDLAAKYFWVASKGFRPAAEGGAGGQQPKLTDRAKLELEALLKVGLARNSASSAMALVNALLVACGLIKAEERRLAPPKGADLRGPLFALAGALKALPAAEPRATLRSMVLRAVEQPANESVKSAVMAVIYSF
ncbi:PREDICTED: ran GTPase-activating protein 1-like [Rhagoletis zephyria]|uniref:ran GTPase-activating protein 1-like n=1 Tax=Rhagoletis zephyria TaxID=28612 RepID=UPI0008113404|nr:PREDICTED: ran GTPase-activating protein 1-like [Rhagoletis zephyria]